MKFTAYEPNGIAPFIAHSPFMIWLHALFGIRDASYVIGVLEFIDRRRSHCWGNQAVLLRLGAAMSTITYLILAPLRRVV